MCFNSTRLTKEKQMKNIFVILTVLSLSACGTVAGMGEDVTTAAKWSGKKISKVLK
tara:strand:- start:4885 stop:5052 length:168 start_codon:yes stop_codon:yes gene_type:complete